MTIPESEAAELARPTAVPRDAAEKVLEYLIFHRSLLGAETAETDGSALLERYLKLVENLKEGVHVVIDDPFQKATAVLFELVLDNAFDPWEIDLARFVQAYVDRVRSDAGIDFAVAGRLVAMAWNILYLQSEELLRVRDRPPSPEAASGEGLDAGPIDDGYLGELSTPEAVDVTTAVLESDEPPPLLGMVRHPETRPVTLLELVRAFGEAEADARRAIRLEELRAQLREEQRAPPEILVHGDIPERDVQEVWDAAARRPNGEPFPLLSLWRPAQGVDRLVALFLAALYLAKERALDFEQEALNRSPILLVRVAERRPEPAPSE